MLQCALHEQVAGTLRCTPKGDAAPVRLECPAMDRRDFSFDLPPELIAQTPLPERSASRLLVLDGETGRIEDRMFTDLVDLLRPHDLLVLNDTRVLPARLLGKP